MITVVKQSIKMQYYQIIKHKYIDKDVEMSTKIKKIDAIIVVILILIAGFVLYKIGYISEPEKKDIPDIMAAAKEACKIMYAKGGYKNPKMQEAWDNIFPNTNYREAHRAVDDAIHEAEMLFEMYKRGDYKIEP